MPRKHRKKIILGAVVLLVALLLWALDVRLAIRNYEVNSNKITSPVRLVLVTDHFLFEHCAGTFIGQALDQQRMRDAAVNDEDLTHAILNRVGTAFHLGNHAA